MTVVNLEKRIKLRDQVVNLVKEFARREGGVTIYDLKTIFGEPRHFGRDEEPNVTAALCRQPLNFSDS